MPSGISLSSAGVLSGTPASAGTFTFTTAGTDSSTTTHATFTSTSLTLVIAPIAPGTPTIGTAAPGNGQATVAFTAPASNGGAAITSYTVTASPGGATTTSASSPITVTGLSNGTSYAFTVTATNTAGTSAASAASNSVMPIAMPVAGATSTTVGYNSSANAIALNLSGGTATSVTVASVASHGTATASGTTISYTPVTGFFGSDSFTYTATNGFGTSSAGTVSVTVSAPTITVTPTTLPNGVGLVAYSQTLTASGGKAPYTFTGVASGALPSGFSLSSAGVVSGTTLVTGTYTFTVTGTDASTLTHATFTSSTITLNINSGLPLAPGIPSGIGATAGNAQAAVTFTPPVSNGGATITSYTVTSNPGGVTATGAASPITISGLTNGVAYTFTVAATNSAGTGIASGASNSVTPIAPPIAGVTSAVVAYGSTANAITLNLTGGAPVSVAVVAQASHGVATASGTTISYTPSTSYYGTDSFTFKAINGSGTSTTATATITINGPIITITPSVPASDTVGSTYSQALSGNGGQSPYSFSTTLASGALPAGLSISGTGAITGTPTTAGTSTFTVSGTDSSTPAHASFISSTISLTITAVLAGAPTIGTATTGNTQATVTFTPPASNGGSPITNYTVTAYPGGLTANGSASPITVTGLTNGIAYTFTVTATNAAGVSSASAASNSITPVGAPGAGAVNATVAYDSSANPITLDLSGSAAISVAVSTQPSHGTATASGTAITYSPTTGFFGSDSLTYTGTNGAGTSSPATVTITVTAPTIVVSPTTLPSGTPFTAYSQTLVASGGQGPYTFATTVASGSLPAGLTLSSTGVITGTPTTLGTSTFTVTGTDSSTATHATFTSGTINLAISVGYPGPPTIGTATLGNAQATISFTPPASNGGSTILYYTVTSSPGGITTTGTGSPLTVGGLTNGTAYTFTVTATNVIGTGNASAASNSVTPLAPPIAGAASATIAYNSTANPITLNLSGGAAASAAVASAASHGTATASGTSIAYTPSSNYFGPDSFTYTATNASGTSAAATVTITVTQPTISVTPISLTSGTYGSAYSQTLTVSGGLAPYTFATALASGALPGGLSLSNAGVITGTPTAVGTFTFTVSGTDSTTPTHASFTSSTLSLTIAAVVPGAPTIGTASIVAGQVSVSFTAPNSNGGSAITGYTVTSSPGGITATGTGSPITVTGVANGTAYTFTVTATNSAGTGPASAATNSITLVAPPVSGATTATVGYDSSANPITLNLTGGTPTSVTVVSGGSHGAATASGATITYSPTTGYFGSDSFTYNATNANGTSGTATVTITVNAPTITVTPTTLPSGTLLTAYSQTLIALGGQTPYTFATTVASGSLPAGLTLSSTGAITGTPTIVGTSTFTVTGTDSSTATHATFTSATITLVITALLPGSPTIGTATAGNAQATVTFTAPASAGGSPVTSYTVTSLPGNATGTGTGSPITVTGLTNGTAYTFTVNATNAIGTGPASAASNPVTPLAPPTTGAASTTVAFDSSANPITLNLSGGPATSVAIASAASHGTATASGTAITYTPVAGFFGSDSFTYTATNGSGTSSPATVSVTVSAPTIAVSPSTLAMGTDGTAYSQTLTASGGQAPYTFATGVASGALPDGLALSASGVISGTPTASGTFTFTVSGADSSTATHASFSSGAITITIGAIVPGAPTIAAATAGANQASVAFAPPVSNGGGITSYTVTSSPGGLTGTGPGSPIVVTGLTNGTAYTFTVTATNSAGTGPPSAASNSVTPKTAQAITFSNPGPQSFTTSLTLSASASSSLTVTFTSATPAVCAITAGGMLSFVTTGTCTIAADQTGDGTYQAASEVTQSFTVSAGAPGAPTIGTPTAGNAQASVPFTAPSANGGTAITGYTVISSPGGFTGTGTGSPITIAGLTNGTAYTFTVTATNSAGTGASSAASNPVTPKFPQTITFANPGTQSFNTSPTLTATATSALAVTFTSATPNVCGVTTAGVLSFVSAGTCTVNADQAGNSSYAVAPTVTQSFAVSSTVPGAPVIGMATAGNTQASVSFNAPASNGGVPITSYTVISSPGGFTGSGTSSPIIVAGLTNGTSYTFTVTATNSVGVSVPSAASNSITSSSSVTAGATSATVAYNSTSSPITLNVSGGAPTSVAVITPPSHGTAIASGATMTYTPMTGFNGPDSFTYTATNSSGTSGPATVSVTVSAPIISVIPSTLAAGTVGTFYSQTLTASGGKGPYTFSPVLASGALPAGLALSTSGLVSGSPTAGGTFTLTVSGADSSTGAGPASFTSATLSITINALLPGAPVVGAATPGSGQASVSFTPPALTGGSPITSYTVTSSPGGFTGTGTGSPIVVAGLTNGVAYTFTITAANSAGTGASSAPSNSITPAAAPVAGAVSATVAYDATAGPITLNLTGGAATSVTIGSAAGHGTATASATSISYTPTSGYYGPDSFSYTATNSTATSAPATVIVTVSAPTISVAPTTLPAGADGSFYVQTLTPNGGQSPYTFSTTVASGSLPTGLALSATGVLSGTPTAAGSFAFTVSGTDSSTGGGPASFTSATFSLTIAAILPGAPITGVATAGDTQASITFSAPSSLGGDAILHHVGARPEGIGANPPVTYTATSSPGGVTGSSLTSPILVTGLTNGTPYTFTIAATNSAGTGPVSAATNQVTPQGPQIITFANPGTQTFGTSPTISATSSSTLAVLFSSGTPGVCAITPGGTLSFASAGTCTVNANQAGNAAFTAAAQVVDSFSVSAIVPGTPTLLAASAGNGQSTISFDAPASSGGSPVVLYTVTSNPGGLTATASGSPITITGLANGTAYNFTITATNIAGTGLSSVPSNSIIPSATVTASQAIASTILTQNHAAAAFDPVLGGSGVAPLTYSVSPALPAGLSISATTGAISGTPAVASPATTYAVTVADANLATATAGFSLTVNVAVSTVPGTAPSTVTQGIAVTPFTPVTGAGGLAPFVYTVSPTLPAGLSINPATGQISGTPSAASAATVYTVTVTDANGATSTATFTLGVVGALVAGPKSVTAAYNANGTTSTAIDLTSSITGGTATSIALATAPAHGSATVSGLVVTYTPTQGFDGSDSFTYTASAGAVVSSAGTVSITIPAPTISAGSSTLPGGAVGVVYSGTIVPTGGAAPYTISVSSGSLPAGLSISSTGVISGTPTTPCTCTFTVTGTDSSTPPITFSITRSLTIVGGTPTVGAVTPNLGLATGGTTVTITGTNFTDTSLVSFGSMPATSVSYIDATTISAVVPAGTGVVDTIVTTAAGSSPVSTADQFTYLAQAGALSNPLGTAVDGNGNTFIADPTLGYIVEIPAGCTSITCEMIVGSGLTDLTGVSIDGNGNLIALSGGSAGTVTEFTYDAATGTYGQQTIIDTGLNLPTNTPTGVTVDDLGNIFITDTEDHTVIEEPYNNSTGTYGAPITLTEGSAQSLPSGIAIDGNGDVIYADPGTGTIDELLPGSSIPIVLASGVSAQSVTVDASGNVYYTDPATNTVVKIPFNGTSYGMPVVIATGLNDPLGISVDDNGDLQIANNGTKSLVDVIVDTPPSFTFASTKQGATSSDSPHTATLANIGTAALTFPPTSAPNPALTPGYAFNSATTCPQVASTASAQTLAEGGSCGYAISFSPVTDPVGTDAGMLTLADDNLNSTGATQSIQLTGIALADDTSAVILTLNPAASIVFGKTVAITAAVRDTSVAATIPTGSVNFTSSDGSSAETTIASAVALAGGSAATPAFKPSAAGTYTLTGSYTGAVGSISASTGTTSLVVTRAAPTLGYTPVPATQVYGTAITAGALDATAVDSSGAAIQGSFVYTTVVNSASTTLAAGSTMLPAGSYSLTATFIPADAADYTAGGTITAPYTVTDSTATISLSNLSYSYNGMAHSATVTTTPANLPVTITYDGSTTPPTTGGSHTVVATVTSPNYIGTATGALIIAKVPVDSVTLVANPNPVLTTTPVTLTATVSSALGTPTGTVNFVNSGANNIVFASAQLIDGVATLTTSAEPLGIYNLVAQYVGDTNFLPQSSPVFVSTVLNFTVTVDPTSSTATTDPGGNAQYAFAIAPDGSATFRDPVTFTISGQPVGSTYTINPATIPAGSGPVQVALDLTVPQNSATLHHDVRGIAPLVLGLLLLPFARRLRHTAKRLARVLSLAAFVAVGIAIAGGLSGCGPASGFYGGSPGGPKTYTITLTATSGKLQHSSTVTLTVP